MPLEDQASILRSGQALIPDPTENAIRQQMLALQKRQIEAEIADHERKARQEEAFQTDLEGVMTNPTAAAYSRLILRHPQFKDQVKSAWDLMDASKQKSDLTQMGEIYSAAANGRYDLAAAALKRRILSDKAAMDGEADPQDEAMLAALESNDPTQQKAAMGMIGLHLATITGPEKFEQTLGVLTKGHEDFTLSPGSQRYDSEGHVIASSPFAPRPLTVKPGETIVEYQPGGGDQGSAGGGATAPRRAMGWTPRKSNGGDNNDRAVDNKLGVIAKTTGYDLDAQLDSSSLPTVFDAIAKTEGMGSEFNNPGGIKDGAFAKSQPGYKGAKKGFAVFDSATSGRQAGLTLLGQFYNRGQRTIRDIIEGAPTDQASAGGGGGPKVIATGGAKPLEPSETRSVNGQIFVKIDGQWFRKKS